MKLILSLFSLAVLSLTLNVALAKNINLYDAPKDDAKVVGVLDGEAGFVPIFTPKDSEWVKVGDPKNGNVGWIKANELSKSGSSGFSFKIINMGTGPNSYQIIQMGSPHPYTTEQSKNLFKQMELHQQTIQKDMQQMIKDLQKNWENLPTFMPIILMPAQSGDTKKPESTSVKTISVPEKK